MFRLLRCALPATAMFGLLLGLSVLSRAADEKEEEAPKGVIKGVLVDREDKAVEGARVALMKPRQRGQGGDQAAGARREPLATATTDKEGKFELKFELKNVEDGEYRVICRVENQGMAMARITVKGGKAVDEDGKEIQVKLKLGDMPVRRAGGAGGQQ